MPVITGVQCFSQRKLCMAAAAPESEVYKLGTDKAIQYYCTSITTQDTPQGPKGRRQIS